MTEKIIKLEHGEFTSVHESSSLLSIAISLKRIADAIHGDQGGFGILDFLAEIDRGIKGGHGA